MEISLESIAVALADEGVPLRAIARVTRIPSADLRERLRDARDNGDLIALPSAEDWPIGYPRDKRAMQLARLTTHRRPELEVAVQHAFDLAPVQASLLIGLLQHDHINKNAVREMNASTVDVHIHRMRQRLKPFKIMIETVWGVGYRIPAADRRRALALVLQAAD
jgi:hypothetical protein